MPSNVSASSSETFDFLLLGAGIIGMALARELSLAGVRVGLLERGQCGQGASRAAAGMLAVSGFPHDSPLAPLARAAGELYPEFLRQLEAETGMQCDYRRIGTLAAQAAVERHGGNPAELAAMPPGAEPELRAQGAWYSLPGDHSVNPRALCDMLLRSLRSRGVAIFENTAAQSVAARPRGGFTVATSRGAMAADQVVFTSGAWTAEISGGRLPVTPCRGQMLALEGRPELLRHVLLGPDVYLVPQSSGRILAGSTLEYAGFDQNPDAATLMRLRRAAIALAPALEPLPTVETWAGLRPDTSDHLPLLGEAGAPGLWSATGHYRDGILLAPITARLMAALVRGRKPEIELSPFAPARLQSASGRAKTS